MPKSKSKTNHSQTTKICKIASIVLCSVAILAVATYVVMYLIDANSRPGITADARTKAEIKEKIQYVDFSFDSYPFDTDVSFDFVGKTKFIKHYTSGSWTSNDETVEYNRYDELFDFLYDKIFKSNADLSRDSDCCALKPVYTISVFFKNDEEIKPIGSSFSSSYNSSTKQAQWSLAGHIYPENWEELLKIAELDDSIFSEGTSFDLHHTSYEDK